MSLRPVIGLAYAAGIAPEKYDRYAQIIRNAGGEPKILRTVKQKDIRYLSDGSVSSPETDHSGVLKADLANMVKFGSLSDTDIAEVMQGIDGIFLPGGKDVCPSLLKVPEVPDNGGEPIDIARDISDYLLARYCMENDVPVLAICHGEQILGIADGCGLVQSMEKVYPADVCAAHRMPPQAPDRDYVRGEIFITDPDSIVAECAGGSSIRNSALWHHQCLSTVRGSHFSVTAVTRTDGIDIIQAIERKDLRFCVGLQFHPEIDCGADMDSREKTRCDERVCMKFFEKLISAASIAK